MLFACDILQLSFIVLTLVFFFPLGHHFVILPPVKDLIAATVQMTIFPFNLVLKFWFWTNTWQLPLVKVQYHSKSMILKVILSPISWSNTCTLHLFTSHLTSFFVVQGIPYERTFHTFSPYIPLDCLFEHRRSLLKEISLLISPIRVTITFVYLPLRGQAYLVHSLEDRLWAQYFIFSRRAILALESNFHLGKPDCCHSRLGERYGHQMPWHWGFHRTNFIDHSDLYTYCYESPR